MHPLSSPGPGPCMETSLGAHASHVPRPRVKQAPYCPRPSLQRPRGSASPPLTHRTQSTQTPGFSLKLCRNTGVPGRPHYPPGSAAPHLGTDIPRGKQDLTPHSHSIRGDAGRCGGKWPFQRTPAQRRFQNELVIGLPLGRSQSSVCSVPVESPLGAG